MGNVWLELGILVALIVADGFFSASELGVVSSRRSRLEAEAERGVAGAGRATGALLATAQFGISLIGTVSAVFVGDRLTAHLQPLPSPLLERWASGVADAIVVPGVTCLSLVLGEPAPRSIALRNPEELAVRVAPFFAGLSVAARPVVWLLDLGTRGLPGIRASATSG